MLELGIWRFTRCAHLRRCKSDFSGTHGTLSLLYLQNPAASGLKGALRAREDFLELLPASDAVFDRMGVGRGGVTFNHPLPNLIRAGALGRFLRQIAQLIER